MNPNQLPSNGEIREILVKRIDQQKQAVGIVVGVIEPAGRRVVAYGNLALSDTRALDGDTIFEIGSISKVFTSLLLADMMGRGEVGLDDPAGKYLPEGVKMPERNGRPIMLLDLATHHSGLPPLPTNRKLDPRNLFADDYSVDDLYHFLSSHTLSRDPSSEFEYSNLGAGLLGHVLALRAGSDYEGLVGTRIAQPLNMQDTGIALPSVEQRMAIGHNAKLAPVAKLGLTTLAGAGALRSSANDMLTLLEAFLGYKESPLATAMRAMLETRRPAGQAQIGLGWLVNSSDGQEIVWHNGGTGGFRSFAGYDPAARTGVVVLSNASTMTGVDDIGFHLLYRNLPLADIQLPTEHTEVPIDPKLLDNYTGRYRVTPNLIFEISREGDRLFGQGVAEMNGQSVTLPKFELFAEGEKHFFAKVADNQIAFETGPDGLATSLNLRRAGRDMPSASRLRETGQ